MILTFPSCSNLSNMTSKSREIILSTDRMEIKTSGICSKPGFIQCFHEVESYLPVNLIHSFLCQIKLLELIVFIRIISFFILEVVDPIFYFSFHPILISNSSGVKIGMFKFFAFFTLDEELSLSFVTRIVVFLDTPETTL